MYYLFIRYKSVTTSIISLGQILCHASYNLLGGSPLSDSDSDLLHLPDKDTELTMVLTAY